MLCIYKSNLKSILFSHEQFKMIRYPSIKTCKNTKALGRTPLKIQSFLMKSLPAQISEIPWKPCTSHKDSKNAVKIIGILEMFCGRLRAFVKALNTNVEVFTNNLSINRSLNKRTITN